jgi:ubiquinone/menaquinone biosynthesis C-methylase UbiE
MHTKDHWQHVYTSKSADSVSWFQPRAETSLRLIGATGVARSAPLIDVGGGASTLVEGLLADGYSQLSVLDISAAALAVARERLGQGGSSVQWIEADVTEATLPAAGYALWHDRAAFHFLTTDEAVDAYRRQVLHAVQPGGHLIIATFAEDGPVQCSGLVIRRYSQAELQGVFAGAFQLRHYEKELHRTPWGSVQSFGYCSFERAV